MSRSLARMAVAALLSLVFAAAALAPRALAGLLPLRSGTVVSKKDAGVFTYIKAVDDAGKEFWVLTSICTVGEKGKIAVLAGAHYDKVQSEHLGGVLEDVYTALQLKIGDVEVAGFGAHGLPPGCLMLK